MMNKQCDLILLSWNRRDLLEPCVGHILKYTRLPCRLIIVDNASTDEATIHYLKQIRGTEQVDVDVIWRKDNGGFAKGMNEGLRQAQAPWLCLINNDLLVTEGWLEEMIQVARSNPLIGLLNPMSSEFNVHPRPGEDIHDVARRMRAQRGRWTEMAGCVAFCMLFSARVFEKIGYLDEGYEGGYFEDADYSVRVRQAGFNCAMAEGTYVHHHRGASMGRHPQRVEWFEKNGDRFYKRWHMERPYHVAFVLEDEQQFSKDVVQGEIRRIANAGHQVWVYAPSHLIRHIPRHFNVFPVKVHTPVFSAGAIFRILTKKKRFHRILVSGPRTCQALRGCSIFHKADVQPAPWLN